MTMQTLTEPFFTSDGQPLRVEQPPTPGERDDSLGWQEPGEVNDEAFSDLGLGLSALNQFISAPVINFYADPSRLCTAIATRVIAAIYATNPAAFQGLSQEQLGERIGVTKQAINRVVQQFKNQFPVKGPIFRTPEQRQRISAGVEDFHRRKKKALPEVTRKSQNEDEAVSSPDKGAVVNQAEEAAGE